MEFLRRSALGEPAASDIRDSCLNRRSDKKSVKAMQVSHTNRLEGGRDHYSIGRIKACAGWRAADTFTERDHLAAVQALIREAQEYDADAIISLDFEVDGVKSADIGGAPLQRVAATGIAVKFADAA
jgi:uncharacterized protein YbjQ (UPF0145 family)